MKARNLLGILAVALATTLTACGGGDDKASGKPQADGTYKKADLAVAADKVCAQTKQTLKGITPIKDSKDPAQVATFLETLLPATQAQAAGLAALKPASDVASDYNALLAKEQQIVALFTTVLAKAKAKDPSGEADLAASTKLGPEFVALAKKIGAKTCAS